MLYIIKDGDVPITLRSLARAHDEEANITDVDFHAINNSIILQKGLFCNVDF